MKNYRLIYAQVGDDDLRDDFDDEFDSLEKAMESYNDVVADSTTYHAQLLETTTIASYVNPNDLP